MSKKFLVLFSVFVLLSIFVSNILISPVSAYYTNMSASVVVGQPDFTGTSVNQGGSASANTLRAAENITTDGTRLFIADRDNNRVLIWNRIPTQNNTPADVVVGQPDFVSATANQGGSAGANTLNAPRGIFSDGTRLFISDLSNGRVLIFNTIPKTNNVSADIVVGQSNMSGSSQNQGGGTTAGANTLSLPQTVNVSNGQVFIADGNNNRVLIYNSIPTSNNASADIVVGQPNFSASSINQGGSVGSNTLGNAIRSLAIVSNRLYIPDGQNNRILIYNSIPTTNNASADIVIGQANFTTSSTGSGPSANTLNAPRSVSVSGNKLVLTEVNRNRAMIFDNIIDTPSMNINLPLEKIDDTHLRVRGNIQLGDRTSTYAMQWVKAEVNGQGLGFVSNLGGGRDNGDNLTLYDFFHEFNPTTGVNTDMNNYTLKLVASSFNADQTSLFYFQPFNFDFIRKNNINLNVSFHVNSTQIQKVKDNIDHFEIQTSTDSGKFWKKYSTNITTDKIDANTGQVYVTIPNSLLPGVKYSIRMIAVSRDSNWQQPSNILNYFVPKKKVSTR